MISCRSRRYGLPAACKRPTRARRSSSPQRWRSHSLATRLQARANLLPRRGSCPVCGSMPVGAVITASGRAPDTRYLHCGLWATAWNHVRTVCADCGG